MGAAGTAGGGREGPWEVGTGTGGWGVFCRVGRSASWMLEWGPVGQLVVMLLAPRMQREEQGMGAKWEKAREQGVCAKKAS